MELGYFTAFANIKQPTVDHPRARWHERVDALFDDALIRQFTWCGTGGYAGDRCGLARDIRRAQSSDGASPPKPECMHCTQPLFIPVGQMYARKPCSSLKGSIQLNLHS